MFRTRRAHRSNRFVPLAFGATAGLAAGLLLFRRRRREQVDAARSEIALIDLEEAIVDRLVRDPVIGTRSVEVSALADGLVELTGSVRDEEESDHAVRVARAVPGVRTVLNRLTVETLEEHLAETRERFEAGDPALTEAHWYGIGVGMGRRRQGRSTDPAQRDDRNLIVEKAIGGDGAGPFETGTELDLEGGEGISGSERSLDE